MLRKNTFNTLHEHGFATFYSSNYRRGGALLNEVSERLECEVFSGWHTVSPTENIQASPVSYSGLYGLNEFPMHTDLANWRLPPRFLVLWAEIGAEDVSTPVTDCLKIADDFDRRTLARALVKPRRPVQGRLPIMRLYEDTGSTYRFFRWDPIFLKPASPAGRNGIALMSSLIAREKQVDVRLERSGDGVIIDNWRMLHGRSAVKQTDTDRRLRRAYLGRVR